MSILLEGAIESSVILLLALGLMPILRGRSAALRHGVLTAALVCAAAAPLLGRVVPSWHLPVALTSLTSGTQTVVATQAPGPNAPRSAARGDASSTSPAKESSWSGFAIIRAVWMTGVLVGIVVLGTGLAQLARLATRARRLQHGVWTNRAESIARELGLARPVALLLSAHPSLLVTWGLLRPKVVLPSAAASWPDERVRIVLYHELAHVRRHDWIVLVAAEALKCVYWFNPLMWVACARLRRESEQACDDAVMNRGVDGSDYATVLVDIARDLKHRRRLWLPAPAIARPSSLERRVRAMLDTRVNRRPVSRSVYAGVVFATLALTITIASAQGGFASLTGSIVDPTNGVMPGVTLVLTNAQSQAKYEVRTDRTGRYEFVGVPAGDYLFEAKLPGFAAFKGTLIVGAQNLQRDLTMEVGSLQETITVISSRSAASASVPTAPRAALPKRPRPVCDSTPTAGGLPIGGNIRPPAKLKDVRPLYPAHLAAQGVEGVVTLNARIGTAGMVEDLEVVSAPHEDLGHAAADAVRQWEFDETLLNCKPVAVSMKVTVNFGLQRP